jgi:hypothetical protein
MAGKKDLIGMAISQILNLEKLLDIGLSQTIAMEDQYASAVTTETY